MDHLLIHIFLFLLMINFYVFMNFILAFFVDFNSFYLRLSAVNLLYQCWRAFTLRII
jgi:uncharacterized protein YggT (Ycf19 family)